MSQEALYTTTLCSLLLAGCGPSSDETLQLELDNITAEESTPTSLVTWRSHPMQRRGGLTLDELLALELVEPESLILLESSTSLVTQSRGGDGAESALPQLDPQTPRRKKPTRTPKDGTSRARQSRSRKGNRASSGNFPPVV